MSKYRVFTIGLHVKDMTVLIINLRDFLVEKIKGVEEPGVCQAPTGTL